jgi:hypothetical protein
MVPTAQRELFESVEEARSLDVALLRFRELPYRKGGFGKKNWGSPLHSLCSYPSKLKPALAHVLVTYFTEPGMRILDPFSGCGTVPLEACLCGRVGIGADLSPLAFRLTSAKVALPSLSEIRPLIVELQEEIGRGQTPPEIVSDRVRAFYHEETLREILVAKQFLNDRLSQGSAPAYFLWSVVAHLLHGNRPYALSRRSHNIIPIPPKGELVYKSLIESLSDKIIRLFRGWTEDGAVRGEAHQADASLLSLAELVDAIITSPPFLSTTEFLKQNWVRMWFCDWTAEVIESKLSQFLEYQRDLAVYGRFFENFKRLLKPAGLAILHLGVVKELDMGKELGVIVEDRGFERIDLIYEDVAGLENHGRTDRGGTHKHQFLFLRAR